MELGRSSISTAGSCLPSPPSPLFGPSLKNTFIPNYVRGSTKFNRKRKNKPTKPLHFPGLELLFWHLQSHPNRWSAARTEPGKESICLRVGGRRNRLCVTQPGPSRPRRHEAEGQVFLFFFFFKYQVVTQTQRHAESPSGKSSNPKVQSMKCSVFPQSWRREHPWGNNIPSFPPLVPTKGTALCP